MTNGHITVVVMLLLAGGVILGELVRLAVLERRRRRRRPRKTVPARPATVATVANLYKDLYKRQYDEPLRPQSLRSEATTDVTWPPWPRACACTYKPALPRTVAFDDEPTLELVPHFGDDFEEAPTEPRLLSTGTE